MMSSWAEASPGAQVWLGPRAIWTLLVLGPEPRPSPGSWALGLAVLDILNFDRSQGCSHPSPLYTSATPGEKTSGGPGAARGHATSLADPEWRQ